MPFTLSESGKDLKKIKSISIISLTAFVDEATLSNIMKKGADMIINKPLSQLKLNDVYGKIKCQDINDL